MSKPIKQDPQSGLKGLVISYFGNSVAVEANDGKFSIHLRKSRAVVGDKVHLQLETENSCIITKIEPRHCFYRVVKGMGVKPIAANIDALLIVMSPPIFSEYLIDCYLVAAELLKIHPILVLNKEDLLDDQSRQRILRLQPYRDIPYSVILSSIYTKEVARAGEHFKARWRY